MDLKKRIYLSSPHMSDEGYEQEYIQEAFSDDFLSSDALNIEIESVHIRTKRPQNCLEGLGYGF